MKRAAAYSLRFLLIWAVLAPLFALTPAREVAERSMLRVASGVLSVGIGSRVRPTEHQGEPALQLGRQRVRVVGEESLHVQSRNIPVVLAILLAAAPGWSLRWAGIAGATLLGVLVLDGWIIAGTVWPGWPRGEGPLYHVLGILAQLKFGGWSMAPVFLVALALWVAPMRAGIPIEGKLGRNERCPCGSGLKYKRCCGSSPERTRRELAR